MKYLLETFLVFGFSINAIADHNCPNLAGTWQCKDNVVEVKQWQNQDGVWEYEIPFRDEMLKVVTDGKRHQAGTSAEFRDLFYKARCDDSKVLGKLDGAYDGIQVDLDAKVYVQDENLMSEVWGTAMGFPVSQSVTCQPK